MKRFLIVAALPLLLAGGAAASHFVTELHVVDPPPCQVPKNQRWCDPPPITLTDQDQVQHETATVTVGTTTAPPPPPPPVDCASAVDRTAEIQALINSTPDGGTVQLEGCSLLSGTLGVSGRQGLTFQGPAELRGQVGDGHRSIFRLSNGGGHTFRDLTLSGGYGNPGVHDTAVQWSHGIDALGVLGLTVENVTVRNVAGDCYYLGLGALRTSGVTIRSGLCDGTGRNGVSFVASNQARVEGGTYDRIGFIAFDVEPNPVTGSGVDGAVVDGAQVGSFRLDVGGIYGCNTVSNVTFANTHTFGAAGARFTARADCGQRRSNVTVSGNTASSTRAGDVVTMASVDGLTVTNNALPTTGVLLRCSSVTSLTFSGNTPNTQAGC